MTRDDLARLRLRGGYNCKIWRTILEHRYQDKWLENTMYRPPPPGGEIKGAPGHGEQHPGMNRQRAQSQSAIMHLPPRVPASGVKPESLSTRRRSRDDPPRKKPAEP
ncbi:PREDICTED: uncharacterized protein LOC106819389 [Priapulus caudatus]|uniref:Uncharacterized protein LOC106819389 n=1 Tax=Priapulus caudatus TaxID=37621 RepID=A0ABM1F4Z7_PRICU|nr:PREDICTED: uncharacterized protein LOC106819389 [Priapulus caudatus]